jgi:hypothetical protein
MSKWGNPILTGVIKELDAARKRQQQDATRVARSRPQGVAPERNFARLGALLNAEFGGYAPTYDEMFLEAMQRQRGEAGGRAAVARQREEQSPFYKGRKSAAEYKRAWAWELP